jgi:hypothetical protein
MLYFAIIILMVEESDWCHQQYLNTSNSGPSPVTDVAESKMFLFLAVVFQMGHDIQGSVKDYYH